MLRPQRGVVGPEIAHCHGHLDQDKHVGGRDAHLDGKKERCIGTVGRHRGAIMPEPPPPPPPYLGEGGEIQGATQAGELFQVWMLQQGHALHLPETRRR